VQRKTDTDGKAINLDELKACESFRRLSMNNYDLSNVVLHQQDIIMQVQRKTDTDGKAMDSDELKACESFRHLSINNYDLSSAQCAAQFCIAGWSEPSCEQNPPFCMPPSQKYMNASLESCGTLRDNNATEPLGFLNPDVCITNPEAFFALRSHVNPVAFPHMLKQRFKIIPSADFGVIELHAGLMYILLLSPPPSLADLNGITATGCHCHVHRHCQRLWSDIIFKKFLNVKSGSLYAFFYKGMDKAGNCKSSICCSTSSIFCE
jgi:hypothetical protein